MSNTCLDDKDLFFKNMKSGRLICSFLLLSCFLFTRNALNAQTANESPAAPALASETMSVSVSDVDGDGLQDATFENKNVKVVLSGKTGSPSIYYLKGENFEENLYPPVIGNMGYSIPVDSMKAFEINNAEETLSKVNYNIEVESQTAENVVIKAIANISTAVDENTPDANSYSLVRRYTFSNEGYCFKIENTVANLKDRLITVGDDARGSLAVSYGPGVFMDPFGPVNEKYLGLKGSGECDKFSKAASLNEKGMKESYFTGIGIKDSYFAVMMESDQQLHISCVEGEAKSVDEKKRVMTTSLIKAVFPKFNLGAREARTFVTSIYAGPMIYEELQKINRTGIGEFGFLNTMMLKTLRLFYSWIPNYGIAIILLTLLVRLIMYPLTLNQTKSMAKMQKLQPKLKDLQDRYRDDSQKLNEEIMKLYAKEKVTPLSGCLPLLLQLPIIMALYNTFRIAVELRKSSFLWMSDLSKGDPYLILPIAIAALTYYQQGMSKIDPQQKQAMAFMPMMMFVVTWSFPSGLLVYWFASSVLGLLQQLQTNHMMASMKEE